MWPSRTEKKKAVVVFHIDQDGNARGAWFRGNADVLIIDERDPKSRVYRMGKHPLGRMLGEQVPTERPTLNLHWRVDVPQTA